MEILTCSKLTKLYKSGGCQVTALDQIDLRVETGEFISVMGASGSGKSTLLHLLGTVDRPTSGSIILEGMELSSISPAEASLLRRRKIGLIYQFYNLIPTLTVRKNILLPIQLDKSRPDMEYFQRIIRIMGLEDKLDVLPGELSGGQQQRTAIARALVYRPAILLADEPTGSLDQKNSREIVKLLRYSHQELNQTILLITHDRRVALAADRIITLADGKIISDEPVSHPEQTR